jgi:hypothetical protein
MCVHKNTRGSAWQTWLFYMFVYLSKEDLLGYSGIFWEGSNKVRGAIFASYGHIAIPMNIKMLRYWDIDIEILRYLDIKILRY